LASPYLRKQKKEKKKEKEKEQEEGKKEGGEKTRDTIRTIDLGTQMRGANGSDNLDERRRKRQRAGQKEKTNTKD